MSAYEEIRPLVKNGDVVFFSSHKRFGDWFIKKWSDLVIAGSEKSQFSHIGFSYWLENRLMLLEASFKGGVRMVPMSLRQPDKVVQMNLPWNAAGGSAAFENLGKKYDLWNAVEAGLGMGEDSDDRFMCTEYVAVVCNALGYTFPRCKQLPDVFYNQVVKEGKTIFTIENPITVVKSFPKGNQ